MKKATSFRLSEHCGQLLKELASSRGMSQSAVIEIAVRQSALLEIGSLDRTNRASYADQFEQTVPVAGPLLKFYKAALREFIK